MKKVVIVGGGTGGTMLANVLPKRDFAVTVISASLEHLFQPGLLYVAFRNSQRQLIRNERTLLRRSVHLVHDTVTRVDFEKRRVTTANGTNYTYDYIVLATGVDTDPSQIPGVAEVNERYGDFHASVAQARKAWTSLNEFAGGTLVVGQSTPLIVCPPSPVEAALLAQEFLAKKGLEKKSRIVFFTPYPRAYPAKPINEIVEPLMKERGIEIMPFFDVDRIDTVRRTIASIEGDEVQYDLAYVVPPFVGAKIDFVPSDVVDASGLVITDKSTLRVKGVDAAFAIGDGTNIPTSKAGVGAHLEAKVVAQQLRGRAATFDGRTNCPMDVGYGEATFVIGSYTAPVVRYPPSRLKHFMKMMMGRMYWLSLRGWLEPMFDAYFSITRPEWLAARLAKHTRKESGANASSPEQRSDAVEHEADDVHTAAGR